MNAQDIAEYIAGLQDDYSVLTGILGGLRQDIENLNLTVAERNLEVMGLLAENHALLVANDKLTTRPPAKKRAPRGDRSPFSDALRALQPGESHFEPSDDRKITKRMSNVMQRLGGRTYAGRLVVEGGVKGGRLYRLT